MVWRLYDLCGLRQPERLALLQPSDCYTCSRFGMVSDCVYLLKDLLPAGVLGLYFKSDSVTSTKGPPATESDDWNTLTPFLEAHQLHLIDSSLSIFRDLDSLVRLRLLRATWGTVICDVIRLHIRIYLIPTDHPAAHGSLFSRAREKLEQKKMVDGRTTLFSLLTHVDCSPTAWVNFTAPQDGFEPFLRRQHVSCEYLGGTIFSDIMRQDLRTLSEIYGDLPSPINNPSTFLSGTDERTQKAFRHALNWDSPPGMRPLYAYQRRTVARMLQQELDPGIAPDPLYLPINGVPINGSRKTFYLQPSTMVVLSECPMRSQVKGGILCEEMGTGKTCIILALIMATKHQVSSPEEPLVDEPERHVLTPLALRHFPTPKFERARQAARLNTRPSVMPSLVEMLAHVIRTSPELLNPPGFNDSLKERVPDHIWDLLVENHPFYHVFERVPVHASPRRRNLNKGPRKVYLTSATLVIVPRAILEQWNAEINKHCEAGSIRHIYLDIGPKARPMPSAQDLASMYDVSSRDSFGCV